ncbi:hypothetical protein VTJ04DRAFT_10269 [Mycothermus thermophilus]|uniref:uncharacterized protein n=1 Tax=Humicola insolens TaxID=85995 RepID=UPI003742A285
MTTPTRIPTRLRPTQFTLSTSRQFPPRQALLLHQQPTIHPTPSPQRQQHQRLSSTALRPSPSKYYAPRTPIQPRATPSPECISFLPPPSNDPSQRAIPSPSPHPTSLLAATDIFTTQAPRHLYAASRFVDVPINSHTPEICLLGRSNVGKSTLINALAGVGGRKAARSWGKDAREKGLAVTSGTAGSTRTMNAYGFGLPTKQQRQFAQEKAIEAKEARRKKEMEEALLYGRTVARSKRRKEVAEPPPQFRLILMDMPGYGMGSEEGWGKEIIKYLQRRPMLKGAVLLIDAVAGVKEADRMVMELLRDCGVRTQVVLTKADKLGRAQGRPEEKEQHAEARVEGVCLDVWEELRKVEAGSSEWLEGAEKGWEKEIWVTAAGDVDANGDGAGVAGARWAVCRLAGVLEDNRVLKPVVTPLSTPPRIVSFDEIFKDAQASERTE